MIAVVDFNHTIYDSTPYLLEFNRALQISKKDFHENRRKNNYSVIEHVDNLSENTDLKKGQIERSLQSVYKKLPSFIYEDAIKFLESFKGKKILLTKGNIESQKIFVEKTKVAKYFDEVKFVPDWQGKAGFIKELCNTTNEEIIFINDHPEETKLVIDQLPRAIKIYLVERPNGSFSHIDPMEGAQIVKGLDEIQLGTEH